MVKFRCFILPRPFVSRSAKLRLVAMYVITMIVAAAASRMRWNAIALCFFLSTLDGTLVLTTTLWLSQSMVVGPSRRTPSMRNPYLSSTAASVAIRAATISAPCVDASTVPCRLLCHRMGIELTNTTMPVVDRLVAVHVAWSASTQIVVWTACPLPIGASGGISSVASG